MTTIICKKCNTKKELSKDNFRPEKKTALGFDTTCKACRNKRQSQIRKDDPDRFKAIDQRARKTERYKKYQAEYRSNNVQSLKDNSKSNYFKNKEAYLRRSKEQRIRLGDAYKKYQKDYKIKNKNKLAANYLLKLKNDPIAKLKHSLRNQFRKLIKGHHKQNTVLSYIGCDVEFLKNWLSTQFKEGMSWENHGSVWHVDHIIPCSVFDFSNEDELTKCWNYTNLRPLFVKENLAKSDKIKDDRGRNYTSYSEYQKQND